MKTPNADSAIIDIRKLTDYCLNPEHPLGQHKARVFASVLGLGAADAEMLRDALLTALRTGDAVEGEADEYGRRYTLDFEMITATGQATIHSVWIIRRGEDFPRFVSAYVL